MTAVTQATRQFRFSICLDDKEALLLAYAEGESDARLELPVNLVDGETQAESVAKARSCFIRQLLEADLENCEMFNCESL